MATQRLQVYHCPVCGNAVEIIRSGGGEIVCCGQPMTLLAANTTDAAREKHVPVIEQVTGGVRIKIGSAAHPMESKHYIEWIEAVAGDQVCRRFLKPGDAPEAVFAIDNKTVTARALCNLHGLWKAD